MIWLFGSPTLPFPGKNLPRVSMKELRPSIHLQTETVVLVESSRNRSVSIISKKYQPGDANSKRTPLDVVRHILRHSYMQDRKEIIPNLCPSCLVESLLVIGVFTDSRKLQQSHQIYQFTIMIPTPVACSDLSPAVCETHSVKRASSKFPTLIVGKCIAGPLAVVSEGGCIGGVRQSRIGGIPPAWGHDPIAELFPSARSRNSLG